MVEMGPFNFNMAQSYKSIPIFFSKQKKSAAETPTTLQLCVVVALST